MPRYQLMRSFFIFEARCCFYANHIRQMPAARCVIAIVLQTHFFSFPSPSFLLSAERQSAYFHALEPHNIPRIMSTISFFAARSVTPPERMRRFARPAPGTPTRHLPRAPPLLIATPFSLRLLDASRNARRRTTNILSLLLSFLQAECRRPARSSPATDAHMRHIFASMDARVESTAAAPLMLIFSDSADAIRHSTPSMP